jgi:hypothetical protein
LIDRVALLSDLQSLLTKLEDDLRERSGSAEVPEVAEWLKQEYTEAKNSERTALSEPQWIEETGTQVAVAWVLSCVFARFLEDNALTEPARIAGPGEKLERARDEYTLYFEKPEHAQLTAREYLLSLFRDLAVLPGLGDLFGKHNMLMQLPEWLGPDAAGELIRFFQRIDSETGRLIHDFTDSDWNTRFLGDLYQDLSEKARKKFALLQTPDFVEEFILDRTLEPALDEFGVDAAAVEREGKRPTEPGFRMIDPACGSGHFLLGAFPRILKRWQEKEPGTNVRELVQRTLTSIHGVDINPFAVAIARFRLLLVALAECGIKRMKDAPDFQLQLACGDSLYHGHQQQLTLDGLETDESHYFKSEDAEELGQILREGTFHAVVANPPYIQVKDNAANAAYRRLYRSCHRQYSLAVPFMERIFGLAINSKSVGFTGQITANSFMKREFGKKLIETFLPTIDLTHVVDTSGAYIPGHNNAKEGTSTVVLFGRHRAPLKNELRTVMGIKGEPKSPAIPREGLVWTAISTLVDTPSVSSDFVSVADTPRERFATHPWSIAGGGASELKDFLESSSERMIDDIATSIGFCQDTHADDAFVHPVGNFARRGLTSGYRLQIRGDDVRDWIAVPDEEILFPYNDDLEQWSSIPWSPKWAWLYALKSELWARSTFGGGTYRSDGRPWFDYHQFPKARLKTRLSIIFGEVASHNHFVLHEGGSIQNRTAPVVKLQEQSAHSEYVQVLGLLNSSCVAFFLRQTCYLKKGRGAVEPWQWRIAQNGSRVGNVPLPDSLSEPISSELVRLSQLLSDNSPQNLFRSAVVDKLRENVGMAYANFMPTIASMIRLQEDLDWECYRLYGLLEYDLTYPTEASLGIQLGERAFEIVLARKMAHGEVQTTWFDRHGSQPITELPDHWPDDYKELVQRRIEVIESNSQIALIEQPEYKRRWNTEPWDSQVEKALKNWLLARLESYFDFDGRMLDEAAKDDGVDEGKEAADQNSKHALYGTLGDSTAPGLVSVAQLADTAARDAQFMEVGEVYRDDSAFDVQRLVDELVKGEHVPLLPILRYKPAGMRKRAEWETTWQLQRLEDELRAGKPLDEPRVAALVKDCHITPDQCQQIESWQKSTPEDERTDTTLPSARVLDKILAIPVPPKYKSSDFISTGGARYWALRGKLDVPKERWISLPHCDANDGTLMLCWAGYDHLQQAGAIATYYTQVKQELGGSDDPRLLPLLACLWELIGWLKQWHNQLDAKFNLRMGDYYYDFVINEARELGKTTEDLEAWTPPKTKKKKATKKASKQKEVTA